MDVLSQTHTLLSLVGWNLVREADEAPCNFTNSKRGSIWGQALHWSDPFWKDKV